MLPAELAKSGVSAKYCPGDVRRADDCAKVVHTLPYMVICNNGTELTVDLVCEAIQVAADAYGRVDTIVNAAAGGFARSWHS